MVFENCRVHSRLKLIGSFNSISQSNRAVDMWYLSEIFLFIEIYEYTQHVVCIARKVGHALTRSCNACLSLILMISVNRRTVFAK